MKINEISKKFNISLTKLRYYEKVGLIDKVKRVGNVREYEEKDIERLKMVLNLRDSGLSIKDILLYIKLNETEDRDNEQRDIFLYRRDKMIDKIHELQDNLDCLDDLIYELDQQRRYAG